MHFDVSHHQGSAVHVSTPCSTLASEPNSSQYASSAEWITDRKDDAHEGRTASHQRRPHDRRSRRIKDVDERQLLRPVTKSDARSPSQRSSVQVRWPSPAAPTWVACDPTPARLLPGCDRDQETRSQIDHFSCGAVRSPAQSFSLHRAV